MEVCKVDGCDRLLYAKGYCKSHYYQARRGKQPTIITTNRIGLFSDKGCSFEGCAESHYAKGYCKPHYYQYREGFTELKPLRVRNKSTICTFKGCGNKAISKGYCQGHYQQIKANKELTPLRYRAVNKNKENTN